jgi:transcriptional regulator with XRE-family HTH domain
MAFESTPGEVTARIRQVAERIKIARQRRGWTVAETAMRAGIARNTLTSLEHGKPGVSISAYISTLWVLGLDHTLDAVADPDQDTHGKTLEASRRPERARKSRVSNDEYDF